MKALIESIITYALVPVHEPWCLFVSVCVDFDPRGDQILKFHGDGMNDNIVIPSVPLLHTLTISDGLKLGFGYNPSIGPSSNAIGAETSQILMSKKTIVLTPTSHNLIYDRNITTKKPNDINLLLMLFLFCEMVNWLLKNAKGIQDLETRLNGLGYLIGQRFLELIKLREGVKNSKREVKILEILQFIHGTFWKFIFDKPANDLEKSQDQNDEYMIIDNEPVVNRFVSIPKDYGNLNCGAFIAGIIEGALDLAGFYANVTAHLVPIDEAPLRTVFLIKFNEAVLTREQLYL